MCRAASPRGQFRRVDAVDRARILCTVNGATVEALEGDSVMTVLLLNGYQLRRFEFGDEARAGFCLIGVCQDCWVRQENGTPLRACSTLVEPGMALLTGGGADDA